MSKKKRQSGIIFLNRERAQIGIHDWTQFRNNPRYCNLRNYESHRIKVDALWQGRISNTRGIPDKHWKPFKLEVFNNIGSKENPRWVVDPNSTKEYRSETDLIAAYTLFICDWSESTIDDYGECIEEGNLLAPPAPADAPDMEQVLAGSW